MSHKLTTVSLHVNYFSPNNTLKQRLVLFEVYVNEEIYTLVPLLNAEQRKMVGLPHEMSFTHVAGKAISLRGKEDKEFYLMKETLRQLQQLNIRV